MCMLGTFSQYSMISETQLRDGRQGPAAGDRRARRLRRPDRLVLAPSTPPTSMPGETVIIYGIGGIGANAVQGAAHAGAANIIAVDPLANKREVAEDLGATHSVATAEEAHELAQELTRGVGADKAIITVDVVNEEVVGAAVNAIRKGGTAVITGLADPNKLTVQLSGAVMTLYEKTVKGTLFGSGNPMHDIPNLIGLYQAGKLKLDELVTNTLHARRHQPGLPGHARRQEHPGRGRSTSTERATLLARVDERIVGLRREAEVLAATLGQRLPRRAGGPARAPGKSTLLRAVADGAGPRRRVRRGQRGADAGAAGRPPRPGARARDGLHARTRSSTARCSPRCARAGCSTSRSSTACRRRRSTCSSARWPRARSTCRGSAACPPRPSFRLIAAMNPFDAVGTARVSQAIADRMCRIAIGYQDERGRAARSSSA